MADAVRWIATLSNGETAVENSGEYVVVFGERKPWVKLCSFLAENDLHLTSLRLNYKGRTIHMPRANFTKFGLEEHSRPPLNYSLQYLLDWEVDEKGQTTQDHYIDLIAHYPDQDIHYVQDLQDGNNSWVIVTDELTTMAPTPTRKDATSN